MSRRTLPAYEVADRLQKAAELIKQAGRILDDVVAEAPKPLACRIEAITALRFVETPLANQVRELGEDILAEHEAAIAQHDAECAKLDGLTGRETDGWFRTASTAVIEETLQARVVG